MKFSFASLFTKLTLATSVAGALVGCDEPNYPEPKPVTESTVGRASVLVVNAAPGATGTVVTLDNSPFGSALPYLGASATTQVNAGQRLFTFNEPTNIPSNYAPGTARTVTSRSAFNGNAGYTIFLTDQTNRAIPANQTADQGGIRTLSLPTTIATPAANNARIRFVNLSPSGTYGIYNSITQAPLFSGAPTRAYRTTNNGTTATSVNYANFTEVAATTYTLDVRSSTATAVPIVESQGTFTFAAGKSYTLYVRGVANSTNSATALGISVVQHN
ncbi:DUF4397 domain-containing protein [Hymenobacter sediminis]|uniref:DUF4397 domain-containing protein n=1 Tax=Hymenobacter sediminis TaxID=2218621 RepID=UPI000DA6ACFC|nr:DUF4397 domain-containing protein [Hymenobacter sediminis]RPD46918.1 DUF4397 domain-containing protein [Hymenobacter sediminis]